MQFIPTHTIAKVHCCECGTLIDPNPMNKCIGCIRASANITAAIPDKLVVDWCRTCGKYLVPPKNWVFADRETPQLMGILLQRIKPHLKGIRLVDAKFNWTEPHSRRINIDLTIQKEVMEGAMLQQEVRVEFVEQPHICPGCTLAATENTWKVQVQLRQHVEHKRTFYFLEQLILKHQMHLETLSIREYPEGVDFFFDNDSKAHAFMALVAKHVPCSAPLKTERVQGADYNNNTIDKRLTYYIEIVPFCKDDLLVLPRSNPTGRTLALVTRVSSLVHCLDLQTLQEFFLQPSYCLKNMRDTRPICSIKHARRFLVSYPLDVPRSEARFSKGMLELFPEGTTSFEPVEGMTHIAHLFSEHHWPDDPDEDVPCLGYDLETIQFNTNDLSGWTIDEIKRRIPELNAERVPVIVIKRDRIRKRYGHKFKLARLSYEQDESMAQVRRGNVDEDYEQFMQELEEEPEMRQYVNLHRNPEGEQGDDAVADEELIEALEAM
ncbi:hypothetical protein J8273_8151 [Carpediemonas membranifera]|uniref:60S ribosomal export protein NMD3 n=1 Tax=Carpediemonas membranifera TaxID=201153 RepID=A0A8J6DZ15_9EUKA|nr:hypothetical protein J8273_8151 [Carpediemonas membranifera]|eukprot:KAG9390113.1 hypothetical protein J8273_8151 [Carpediemonas membranifera]